MRQQQRINGLSSKDTASFSFGFAPKRPACAEAVAGKSRHFLQMLLRRSRRYDSLKKQVPLRGSDALGKSETGGGSHADLLVLFDPCNLPDHLFRGDRQGCKGKSKTQKRHPRFLRRCEPHLYHCDSGIAFCLKSETDKTKPGSQPAARFFSLLDRMREFHAPTRAPRARPSQTPIRHSPKLKAM